MADGSNMQAIDKQGVSMEFFTIIPEAQCIIYSNGVYRQAGMYLRGTKVYAKYGAGFVRLIQGGSTTHPKIKWADTYAADGAFVEAHGYVQYNGAVA